MAEQTGQQKDAINQQQKPQPARREPLKVFVGLEPSGACTIRGPADELRKLVSSIDIAIRRKAEGDGSISLPRQAGKGTAPLVVIAD